MLKAKSPEVSRVPARPTSGLALQLRLERLLDRLDQQPSAGGAEIRNCLQRSPVEFCRAASEALARRPPQSPGRQFLATLLANFSALPQILSDPTALSLACACRLASEIARSEPMLDAKLTRWLLGGLDSPPDPVAADPVRVLRLLTVVEKAGCGARSLVNLIQLLRHPEAKVRSKVTLLVGSVLRSTAWVEQRMSDYDARVRSNALETLWRVEAPGAAELFRRSLSDSNNRVVGNALVGLYLLGDRSAVPLLEEMAGRSDPAFRATAAWAMGLLADPTFLPALGRLVKDSEAVVRRNALRALARIRKASGQTLAGSPALDSQPTQPPDEPKEAA